MTSSKSTNVKYLQSVIFLDFVCKNAVSELHNTILGQKVTEPSTQKTIKKSATANAGKKSQQQLIAGAIKRRIR